METRDEMTSRRSFFMEVPQAIVRWKAVVSG
jgi:hypothetical protein